MTRLQRLRRKIRKRIAQRERQHRRWKRTHKRGHAKAAHRHAHAVRFLRHLIRRLTRNGPRVMFDSVDISQIPADAAAVAGYTSGYWPTFLSLRKRFPHAYRLSIAVTASHDADCLDVEPGDADPSDAPGWVKRQKRRGVKRPVVYASVSNMPTVLRELERAGIERREVRVLTAHYGAGKHICGPHTCGLLAATADGTQWTDHSRGRNLDESYLNRQFFA